jgi:hypothetical protein
LESGRARANYGLWLVLAVVLAIRIPFWNQPVQGDDTAYLHEAAHAQMDWFHPDHTKYVFQGAEMDMRGHPHGPLNAWVLGGLLGLEKNLKEVPFHAAYTIFSLMAAWGMWSLAQRFSPQPLWATLLFVAVPAFVVNGNSFETDVPFLALWMAAIALLQWNRPLASILVALAAMMCTVPQAMLLTPILAVWVWLYRRRDPAAWAVCCVPAATVVAWQLFERLSTGTFPARVLIGYLNRFDIWDPRARIALAMHACFLIFPPLAPVALAAAWRRRREPDALFLLSWIVIFFAGILAVFFAGSARYLLPISAPLALLASHLPRKWLAIGFGAQMTLGLALATANYEHWDGYRRVAYNLRDLAAKRRVWVDDEWGLRHYLQIEGALPLTKAQPLRAGDIVVSSELSRAVELTVLTRPVMAATEIRPAVPLRLIGLDSHSGYSTASRGVWPFGVSTGVVDRVRTVEVRERHATRECLTMAEPGMGEQLISGVWPDDRWISRNAVVVLKSPVAPAPLGITFYIPDIAKARSVWLVLDGREVTFKRFPGPGKYDLQSQTPLAPTGATATVEIRLDETFTAPPDIRELGVVLISVGFCP